LATGKVGNGILNLIDNASIKTRPRFEGGVRVETNVQNFKPYELKQIDYKYIEYLSGEIEFRTFCCCKDGQVLESDYLSNVSYNGSIMPYRTGRSNIGLTVRFEDEDSPLAKEFKACLNRHEEFTFDYNENYNRSKDFFLGTVFDRIILERIGLILKSRNSIFKTKIYGPEIEYFGQYPEFDWQTLRIKNENIWVVGDLSAQYRGIIAALISGIYAANSVTHSIGDVYGDAEL
jgi:uncharacterized FAD-dependent dehydrogenase